MSRPKSRSHRQPRYKTAPSPKPVRSPTADMQATFMRRGGVREQGGSTFYSVSWFGTVIMSVATLALGVSAVFALTALPPLSDAGIAWRTILAIPPPVLIWLRLSEPWWFGLTTRTFAKTTPHALILYGAFGRVRQRFDRRECTFSETGSIVPTLRMRRHNRYFSRTIDTALCANAQALICELTSR